MKKILIIEDDLELAEILKEFLEINDYIVKVTPEALGGIKALEDSVYDAIILDLTLPGMDGLEVCRKIRAVSDIPIIISSARSDIGDKIEAFELGANDYLPKPYNPRELLARLQSHIRRASPQQTPLLPLQHGEFLIDDFRHEILKNGTPLDLTRAEFEVLKYMISMNGGTISREEIIINTNAIDIDAGSKSVDVLISRLRVKIGDDAKNPRYIKSVRGVGYRFYQNGVGGGFKGEVGEGLANATIAKPTNIPPTTAQSALRASIRATNNAQQETAQNQPQHKPQAFSTISSMGGFNNFINYNALRDLDAAREHLANAFYSLKSQVFSTPDELQNAITQNFAAQQNKAAQEALAHTFGAWQTPKNALSTKQESFAQESLSNQVEAHLSTAFAKPKPLSQEALKETQMQQNTPFATTPHPAASAIEEAKGGEGKSKYDFKLKNSIDGFFLSLDKDSE